MPLNGLRWSRNSGSANCDMPQSAVFGRPGGVNWMKISHVQNLHIWVQTKIKLMKQILPIRGKVLAHVG